MEEYLAEVSSASSEQKWRYASYKVSIASEGLVENETQVYNGLITCITVHAHSELFKYGTLSELRVLHRRPPAPLPYGR